jgi:hypothetical protein
MQRRAFPARPTGGGSSGGPSRGGLSTAASLSRNKRRKKHSPIILLPLSLILIMVIMWIFFPAKVREVEKEAEVVTHDLAKKAIQAEHDVEDWWRGQQQQGGGGGGNDGGNGKRQQDVHNSEEEEEILQDKLARSRAASARMESQGSRWVDGEKKLKQKLLELYDQQQQGKYLGVPVLTRWLGDDIPVYVTPDMDVDVEQWKKQVQDKYAEMRREEEEWQKEMAKLIEQRERDIGITTS